MNWLNWMLHYTSCRCKYAVLLTYSTAQTQVNKWVWVTHITHEITCEYRTLCVCEYTRSDALPTQKSKVVSVQLENTHVCTCEHSQRNMWALAKEHASTHKWTHEYLQSLAWVTIFVSMSCNRINEFCCTCWMPITGLPWLHVSSTRRCIVMLRDWWWKIFPLVDEALLVT